MPDTPLIEKLVKLDWQPIAPSTAETELGQQEELQIGMAMRPGGMIAGIIPVVEQIMFTVVRHPVNKHLYVLHRNPDETIAAAWKVMPPKEGTLT